MSAHILVVEAESAIQELIRSNLGHAGHRGSCVADAAAALAVIETALPELVLLEWDLPGQSGLSLIRRLRGHARACELPVIMFSARDSEHDKVLALEEGADHHITKPFGERKMLARIHALLRRRLPRACLDTVHLAGLRLDPGTHCLPARWQDVA